MEERESLKRQIELLQNLINTHKSVHGDAPFSRVEQRHPTAPPSSAGRGHSSSDIHPHSSRGRVYSPQSRGSWRKTYSLKNKTPQGSGGHPSASLSSSGHHSSSLGLPNSTSLPSHSRGERSDAARVSVQSAGISQLKKEANVASIAGVSGVKTEEKSTGSQNKDNKGAPAPTGIETQHQLLQKKLHEVQQRPECRHVVLPKKTVSVSAEVQSPAKASTSTSVLSSPLKPSSSRKNSTESKQSNISKPPTNLTTGQNVLPLSALSKISKQPAVKPTPHSSHSQGSTSYSRKSKFTWVKTQNVEAKPVRSVSSPPCKAATIPPSTVLKSGVPARSPPLITASKRTPAKKFPRKLSPVAVALKTSKYRWVSSSAGAQTKLSRRSPSPKALALSHKAPEKGDATKKPRTPSTHSSKLKRENAAFLSNSSQSSRYRWKAGAQSSATASGGSTVARRKSAFHWTSDRSHKGIKGGLVSPTSQRASFTPSPGAFKLRSRMKIIRKSVASGGGSEKGSSPSAVKFSPRSRIHSFVRTPTGVKRMPSRELVSFGRHKLRRLSPTSSRTSLAASFTSHRSPPTQRVFRTRYKMVTRPGSSTMHTPHYNPALTWRTKRVQSARSFLQNRLRAPHDRHPSSTQHWRGSGMCWIGGSLYRVSANKLSRAGTSNMSINRTGRSYGTSQVTPMISAYSRGSSTRHLASRAVQRSLAIIRYARSKKQQKQYCMYYNRFGKCNRGTSCPYIHDPDKVAVCTRFLRGTCKQANGTCPFSHKVAKEKMPVCSYFLKGICNNSDCPYSHVYVSRKAEVCEDFVKGYCPEGEKCKKKHTLVCPDFSKTGSCPRGTSCKLRHRQRVKRSASTSSIPSTRRTRTKEPAKRPRLSVDIPQSSEDKSQTPSEGSLQLPSYISLSSSPDEADTPDAPTAKSSQVKEKKLQIKPRL